MKVYTDVQAFHGIYDISGEANKFAGVTEVDVHESRVFNQATVKRDPGLYDFSGTLSGVVDSPGGANIARMDTDLGSKVPYSMHLEQNPGVTGDLSVFCSAVHAGIPIMAEQGALHEFSISLAGDSPALLGRLLEIGTKTVSDTSTPVQIEAVADGQSVYAVLHVTASSGTLDLTIESDSTNGFPSPVTQFTFAQVVDLTPTSEFLVITPTGGITDTWWRASWTSASTPSHSISVSLGVR